MTLFRKEGLILLWKITPIFCIFLCLYLQDEEIVKKPTTGGSKSKLPKQVQELVALIFDVDTMKNALVEFEVSSAKESLYIIIYIISDV